MLSLFRKVAINTWKTPSDPTIYGFLDIDFTETDKWIQSQYKAHGQAVSLSAVVMQAFFLCLDKLPELNQILVGYRLQPRKKKAITLAVHVNDQQQGDDLSFMTISSDQIQSLDSLHELIQSRKAQIKSAQDPVLGLALKIVNKLPQVLIRPALDLVFWITFNLGLRVPIMGIPAHPMGSILITNLAGFGMNQVLAPLVPFSRSTMTVTVSPIHPKVMAVNNEPKVVPTMTLGFAVDHRYIDGAHASRLAALLQNIFKNPQVYF